MKKRKGVRFPRCRATVMETKACFATGWNRSSGLNRLNCSNCLNGQVREGGRVGRPKPGDLFIPKTSTEGVYNNEEKCNQCHSDVRGNGIGGFGSQSRRCKRTVKGSGRHGNENRKRATGRDAVGHGHHRRRHSKVRSNDRGGGDRTNGRGRCEELGVKGFYQQH